MNNHGQEKSQLHKRESGTNDNQCSINILSWNIHDAAGINGKKVEDDEFLQIINRGDIICLQEIKESLKIPNYRCFSSLRADSRSGGVCIGIKNSLANHLT